MRLAAPDEVADRGVAEHYLSDGHATVAGGTQYQLLGHDGLQGAGELDPDLVLLTAREHVDDAVDRLGGVLGVQGREHEVTGLGGGERRGDGLGVAHLTDEDNVRVLAQHVAERLGERLRVGTDFALVDDRPVVRVQELDRVLDGHDVKRLRQVDDVDQRGKRRGLARSSRSGHQHEPAAQLGQRRDHRRQAEGVE